MINLLENNQSEDQKLISDFEAKIKADRIREYQDFQENYETLIQVLDDFNNECKKKLKLKKNTEFVYYQLIGICIF